MKKLSISKKLMITVCMLVVSVITLSSATYAWLSMNTVVEAGGMNVQAITAKNLLISLEQNSGYDVSATNATNALAVKTLRPSSTVDGANFFAVKKESRSTVEYSSGNYTSDTVFEKVDAHDASTDLGSNEAVAVSYKYFLKTEGAADDKFTGVQVTSIEVTRQEEVGNQVELTKALRVAIKIGDTTKIFAPVEGATTTYLAIKTLQGTSEGKVQTTQQVKPIAEVQPEDNAIGLISVGTDNAKFMTEIGSAAVPVEIVVWYEGQDANCKSANALKVEQLGITVKFAGVEVAG